MFSSGQWWAPSHITQGVPGGARASQAPSGVSSYSLVPLLALKALRWLSLLTILPHSTLCAQFQLSDIQISGEASLFALLQNCFPNSSLMPNSAWISRVPKLIQLRLQILGCALTFPHFRGSDLHSLGHLYQSLITHVCPHIKHLTLRQALGTHTVKIKRYLHKPRPSNLAEHQWRNQPANRQRGCCWDRIRPREQGTQRRR